MNEDVKISGGCRLHKVFFGQQGHLYYLCLYVLPSRSISVLDENLHLIRRIAVKDVVCFQRRIVAPVTGAQPNASAHRNIFEIQLSSNGGSWLQFGLPSTEECEELCNSIQLQFGIPVYNYGSLSANFRAALGTKSRKEKGSESGSRAVCRNYRLVRDDFYAACVGDVLHHLGISLGDDGSSHNHPPAEFSSDYPVVVEGTLEEGSYASFRSLKTPNMQPFSVYRVEWYLSTRRGHPGEFYPMASCMGDTFYLRDFTIGRYVQLRVYKAVGTDANRTYVFAAATRGPIRLGNVMAHNILLNVSKDNEAHDVLVNALEFRRIAVYMKQLPPESLGNPADTLERPATDTDAADNGVPREEDYSDADTASGDDSEPPSADAVANGTKQQQKPIQLESTGSFGSYDNSCDSFFSDLDSEGASPKPPGNKFPSSTGRKLKSAKAPPPKCPSDTHTSRSTDTGEMHDGDGADASTAAKVDLTEPSKDTSQPTARSSADAEPANPSKGPPVPGNQAKTKVAPKAKHTAKSAPAQPGGDAAAMGGVGKLRYALKNLLDKGRAIMRKKPAAKAAQASPAGAIAKAARKCSPPSKAKAAGNPKPPNAASTPMPPATPFLEVHIQCRCTGLSVWTGAVEFELKWTRLDVRDCYEAPQQAHATQEPQSDPFADLDLVVLYRWYVLRLHRINAHSKDSGEQLPLTLRLTSPLQRCTLYHAMLFNKHRGPFYSIDQGERDLQRGLYTDVKDAYAKICKHMARRNPPG